MQAGLAPSVEPIDFFHADCLPIEPEHFTRRPEGQLAKTAISLKTPVAASMSVNREVRHSRTMGADAPGTNWQQYTQRNVELGAGWLMMCFSCGL
jgi:hypothetical protein